MARRSSTEAYEVKGADLMDDTEVRCALQSIFFAKVGCGAERLCLLSMTLDLRRQNGAVEYPERSEIVIVDLPNWMQLRSVEGMIRISRKCILQVDPASRRLTFNYKESAAVPAEMKEILSQFDVTKDGCAHSLPEGSGVRLQEKPRGTHAPPRGRPAG